MALQPAPEHEGEEQTAEEEKLDHAQCAEVQRERLQRHSNDIAAQSREPQPMGDRRPHESSQFARVHALGVGNPACAQMFERTGQRERKRCPQAEQNHCPGVRQRPPSRLDLTGLTTTLGS